MKRSIHLRLSVAFVAVGLALVSVALGLVYLDTRMQDEARARLAVELKTSYESVDESDLWDAWTIHRWLWALGCGTTGVALFGAGCVVTIYDLSGALRRASRHAGPGAEPTMPA